LDVKESIAKGRPQDFSFDVHTATGNGVELEAYLGEKMHLIAIKDGFGQFIHGHPEGVSHHTSVIDSGTIVYAHGTEEESIESEKVNFHLVFPEAGIYKIFVQFRPQDASLPTDTALTAGFWVNIGENVLDSRLQWWMLLLVSLVLMTVLGFAVHRYINKEE